MPGRFKARYINNKKPAVASTAGFFVGGAFVGTDPGRSGPPPAKRCFSHPAEYQRPC